jgi:hypothetical protein
MNNNPDEDRKVNFTNIRLKTGSCESANETQIMGPEALPDYSTSVPPAVREINSKQSQRMFGLIRYAEELLDDLLCLASMATSIVVQAKEPHE